MKTIQATFNLGEKPWYGVELGFTYFPKWRKEGTRELHLYLLF